MKKMLCIALYFSSMLLAQNKVEDFVKNYYHAINNNDWIRVSSFYLPEDLLEFSNLAIQWVGTNSNLKNAVFDSNDVAGLKFLSKEEIYAKFIGNAFSTIMKSWSVKSEINVAAKVIGSVNESDSVIKCILRVSTQIDTVIRSNEEILTLHKKEGQFYVSFDEKMKTFLNTMKLEIEYNGLKALPIAFDSPDNKLLYVGKPEQNIKDGSSFDKTEIMIYDNIKGTTERLTKNLQDDSNPNWYPDAKKIFFESKESGYNQSHIYYIDLEDFSINQYDKDFEQFGLKIMSGNRNPNWSRNYDLAFTSDSYGDYFYGQSLYIFSEKTKNITKIDSANYYFSIQWSDNGNWIYYSKELIKTKTERHSERGVISANGQEKIILDSSFHCFFVDWFPNQNRILLQNGYERDSISLYTFDIETRNTELFLQIKNIAGWFTEFSNDLNNIFVRVEEPDSELPDLYLYNFKNKQLKRITKDGTDACFFRFKLN